MLATIRYRNRAVLAVLVGLSLLLVILWRTAVWAEHTGLRKLHERAQHNLILFVAHLHGELARYEYLPILLATEEVLRNALLHPLDEARLMAVNRYLKTINGIAEATDIYLLDSSGLTVAASNWDSDHSFVGVNFDFRPYFQQAMQGQLGRYYALGTTSLERGYYFAYPVLHERRIIGAVVVKIGLAAAVEATWSGGANEFIVTDPDGIIFISTRSNWVFKTLSALDAERAALIIASRRYGDARLDALPVTARRPFADQADLVTLRETDTHGVAIPETAYLIQGHDMMGAGWKAHVLSSLAPLRQQVLSAVLLAGFVFALAALTALFLWQRQRSAEALRRAHDELEVRVRERTQDLSKTNQRLRREIEERNRAEANLRRAQEELIQAAKLAGLGQMSAGISHELNQPLAAIRSYADNARALLDRGRQDDAQWNLAQIAELTERMAEIIKQLKLFARKTSEQAVPVSLPAVVDAALSLLAARIRRETARVVWRHPPDECLVMGDAVRLEQVFVNLIVNALDAMAARERRELFIEATLADGWVVVALRDTGGGIPPEILNRVFDPFFTTKEAGLGLGLSISYRIIDGFGGVLKAANHPAGGAVFRVELPRAPVPLEPATRAAEETVSHD